MRRSATASSLTLPGAGKQIVRPGTLRYVGDAVLATVDAGSSSAQEALSEYFAELADRFRGSFDISGVLEEASHDYTRPNGLFVLANIENEPVGCGALRFIDADRAEVKRMWVHPDHRGLGLGKLLLTYLEDAALLSNRHEILLDTNGSLTEATALYRRHGYVEISEYNDNPHAQHWFTKELARHSDMALALNAHFTDPGCHSNDPPGQHDQIE